MKQETWSRNLIFKQGKIFLKQEILEQGVKYVQS